MPKDLSLLMTEQQNTNTLHIDEMDTMEILKTINQEDQKVALAVENELAAISRAVDAIYKKVSCGGRLIYIGAGTSGRLGVLDASECPPTYGVSPSLVQGVIAGGPQALLNAIEGAEDSLELAKKDLEDIALSEHDVVCGLAASGRTPYVIGGLEYANQLKATTLSICCVENGLISGVAQYPIEVKVGPEVITGSTRMKAGTAQKMVLNMLSTSVMIKLGKVYGNLMIDVQPTNEKLKERAIGIVETCTELSTIEAKKLLETTGYDVKCAILMEKTGLDFASCRDLLLKYQNNVAKVIRQYKK
ncbi:N-acetylmuramic acid 6-phosphate etherase [Candidatus Stoquefichus sp. SB1]|uniref:N-acetylmuramic acid 6-phosphate etherase n=1 Tax=Candidatus Stoquefichus sp. SB1 TaxID=1658109 RepID=UPI00067ED475|nr:N-acetylmuramic acid 6-phosphate etherase [Candidatus Stoquefichus sp. SB1]